MINELYERDLDYELHLLLEEVGDSAASRLCVKSSLGAKKPRLARLCLMLCIMPPPPLRAIMSPDEVYDRMGA